ncbi:MAG: T9SS type A sorting domain-containing protein [Bacteroidetes bacterium]|nr:T9SS type A sorting domain-containing protein [Bacteroidota bacterium]
MRYYSIIIFFVLLGIVQQNILAQNIGDYRSNSTTGGNWSDPSSWQVWNGSAWSNATSAPDGRKKITIKAGDSITVNVCVSIFDTLRMEGKIGRTATDSLIFESGSVYKSNVTTPYIPKAMWKDGSTCMVISEGITVNANPVNGNQSFYNLEWNCTSQSGNLNFNLTGEYDIRGDFICRATGSSGRIYLTAPGSVSSIYKEPIDIKGSIYLYKGQFAANGSSNVSPDANLKQYEINVDKDIIVEGTNVNECWFALTRGSAAMPTYFNVKGNVVFKKCSLSMSYPKGLIRFVGNKIHTLTTEEPKWSTMNFEVQTGSSLLMTETDIVKGTGTFILQTGAEFMTKHPSGINGNIQCDGKADNGLGENVLSKGAFYTYCGSSTQETGTALPDSISNLTIDNNAGVMLSQNTIVTNALILKSGDLALNGKIFAFKNVSGNGTLSDTATLVAPAAANVGSLGAIITSNADLGFTVVKRGFTAFTSNNRQSISRWYKILPSNNSNLNATFVFSYAESELNGIPEENLRLFRSTDNGITWTLMGGEVNTTTNTVTLTGIQSFSLWTLGDVQNPLVKVGSNEIVPTSIMFSNYPNPFNPTTSIVFSVKTSGKVLIRIFDILGREITTAFDDFAESGKVYSIHIGDRLKTSGIYYARLESADGVRTQKMVYMK